MAKTGDSITDLDTVVTVEVLKEVTTLRSTAVVSMQWPKPSN